MAACDKNKVLTASLCLCSQVQTLVFEIRGIASFVIPQRFYKMNYMVVWRYEISHFVLKNISLVYCAHSGNIFSTLKGKFCVSTQPLNIEKVVQFLGHYFVIQRIKVEEQKSAGLKYRSHLVTNIHVTVLQINKEAQKYLPALIAIRLRRKCLA